MDMRWLIRMSRWARKPPSKRQMMIWAIVALIAFSLAGFEYIVGTPDWMRLEKVRP